jgi:mannan endo-1,4-beta-mannosidase
MKSAFSLVLTATLAAASVIEKRNSNSWAGSNNYYLHALHPEEQATYISDLQSYGTKVVRLWGKFLTILSAPKEC